MTWQRRLAPPILGAGVAAASAALVNAATHPYAEKANDAFREGARLGIVLRYAVIGALFFWLVDVLVQAARTHSSLRAALATRGRPLLVAFGLLVLAGVAAIPLFERDYTASDFRRDERAGFIHGCSRNAPREYCTCMWSELAADPRTDTHGELGAAMAEAARSGPPPALRRAIKRCSQ